MNAHYDFYESLGLDRDSSTPEIKASILETLESLKQEGVPFHDARVQENSIAMTILGDERMRSKYDARLSDDHAEQMGIPELRALASTGAFPEESAATGPEAPARRSADEPASSAMPAARPVSSSDHSADRGARDGASAAAPYGASAVPPQPQTGGAVGARPQSQSPAQPPAPVQPRYHSQGASTSPGGLKQLMDSVPGTAKGLMFTLAGIGAFAFFMALFGMLLMATDSYASVGATIVHLLSPLVAAFLIPKLLRGNDAASIIPMVAAPITMAAAYLSGIIADAALEILRPASTTVSMLIMLAWIAATVLAFLPDTRAWLSGTYVAKPNPAAPRNGVPQYGGQPRYGEPYQPGTQTPQSGQPFGGGSYPGSDSPSGGSRS